MSFSIARRGPASVVSPHARRFFILVAVIVVYWSCIIRPPSPHVQALRSRVRVLEAALPTALNAARRCAESSAPPPRSLPTPCSATSLRRMNWVDWFSASTIHLGGHRSLSPLVDFTTLHHHIDVDRPHETPGVHWRVAAQRRFLKDRCSAFLPEYAGLSLARHHDRPYGLGLAADDLPPIATAQFAASKEWVSAHASAIREQDDAAADDPVFSIDRAAARRREGTVGPVAVHGSSGSGSGRAHGGRRRVMEAAGSGAYAAGDETGAVRGVKMRYSPNNTQFGPLDAGAAYCAIRWWKPRRLIEVGSGWSTRVLVKALAKNEAEGYPVNLTSIEPFPDKMLHAVAARFGRLVEARAELVPRSVFEELQPGDALFIDSSHILRADNELIPLLLQVLPGLPPGVLVHVHDVYLPKPYMLKFSQLRWFWNEQYILHALLAHSARVRVLLANHFLYFVAKEADAYAEAFGTLYDAQVQAFLNSKKRRFPSPSSFWMLTQ
eukprot:TRINITY_DN71777_c0_g1_i1.p1 TRINITY_DN71777_c0_g1~~TRINITY_DN71777_c0_g1_i1.p1  ORF type:complete len:495 (+),score=81.80 TRINITY_DN71777_c0_g1_i1:95-1579(+)